MAKFFANSGDPDQTQRSAASDLDLHCLPVTLLLYNGLIGCCASWKKVHVVDEVMDVHCCLTSGPSCSKLTTSLVNDSLKFTSNDTQICSAKATHIFSAKNFRKLYIESAKIVNEMALNELVKLTTL